MNTAFSNPLLTLAIVSVGATINPDEESNTEKNTPVEPVSEKDEVKEAEEKTRAAQQEIDDKKKEE